VYVRSCEHSGEHSQHRQRRRALHCISDLIDRAAQKSVRHSFTKFGFVLFSDDGDLGTERGKRQINEWIGRRARVVRKQSRIRNVKLHVVILGERERPDLAQCGLQKQTTPRSVRPEMVVGLVARQQGNDPLGPLTRLPLTLKRTALQLDPRRAQQRNYATKAAVFSNTLPIAAFKLA
jgi:hypothetical protein